MKNFIPKYNLICFIIVTSMLTACASTKFPTEGSLCSELRERVPAQSIENKVYLVSGGEFTFKPKGQPNETRYNSQYTDIQRFIDLLRRNGATRRRRDIDYFTISGNTVTYPNQGGFFIELGTDPDVIEVIMKPSTLKELRAVESIINRDLFATMDKLNLAPHSYEGAGHVNLSSPAFEKSPLLFRNFVVDTVNQWEFGSGVFGDNRIDGYGPVLNYSRYTDSNHPEYYETEFSESIKSDTVENRIKIWKMGVAQVDDGLKRSNFMTMDQVRTLLDQAVFSEKYTAVKLADDFKTELRFFRPQKSFTEYRQQHELLEARLKFLAGYDRPISVRLDFPATNKVNANQGAQALRRYVEEAGLNWEEYKVLLPKPFLAAVTQSMVSRKTLPAAARLSPIRQCTSSSCSIAAFANALNQWNPQTEISQELWVEGVFKSTPWYKKVIDGGQGVSLENYAKLANYMLKTLSIEGAKIESFRLPSSGLSGSMPSRLSQTKVINLLKEKNSSGDNLQIVAEINPLVLWRNNPVEVAADETGHYVQIEEFDPILNRVLIVDPYPDYPARYWVEFDTFLRSVNTVDDDIAKARKGFLVVDFSNSSVQQDKVKSVIEGAFKVYQKRSEVRKSKIISCQKVFQ